MSICLTSPEGRFEMVNPSSQEFLAVMSAVYLGGPSWPCGECAIR
nr:hypothetical protein [Halomonas socia]